MLAKNHEISIAGLSIVFALAVMALKYLAYQITGSLALYSDALESIVNVIAGIITLWAIVVSHKPADKNHPFGHQKAEYFAAVLEGILIVIAAALIIHNAVPALFAPPAVKELDKGLWVNSAAGVLNLLWALLLLKLSKKWHSPALNASAWHVLADVITSAGVLLGLILAKFTGYAILDPVLAIIVALHILYQGGKIVTKSLSELMDSALPDADIETIRTTLSTHAKGAIEVHDLRTRIAGRTTFIEFHLVVPAQMSVIDAHKICDTLEFELKKCHSNAQVLIHVEPENEAHSCGVIVL